jgi:hypothetical protein
MKKRNCFIALIAAALAVIGFEGCNVDPTYYSEVVPATYFDSQAKVWQRFERPFTHWSSRLGNIPLSYFTASNTLASDEILMPNRNGDWLDGGFYQNHWTHTYGASTEGYWEYAWDGVMQGVAQSWSAIEDIDNNVDFEALGFEPGVRDWMNNQLKVLVAYFYLVGIDHFGGLPLYTSNQDELKGRASDQETFDYIEKTLIEAIPLLKKRAAGEAFDGTINQGVAAGLLARLYFNAKVYIGQEKYTECEQVCKDIESGKYGVYSLEPDYRSVFGFGNETSSELIWAVPSQKTVRQVSGSRPEYGTHYNTWAYLDNDEAMSWNGICITPSQDMYGKHYRVEAGNLGGPFKLGCPYDKFEYSDVRKQNYLYGDPADGAMKYHGMFLYGQLINPLTGAACVADGSREYAKGDTLPMVDIIAQICPTKNYDVRREGFYYAEENSGVRLLKFSPIPNNADNANRFNPDVPVIRFAEIRFMLAEIAFDKGDKGTAANILNSVRSRYFPNGDPNPVTAVNLDKYRLADEWLIEFIGEGRRRTDLVRWGMYTTEAWWDHPADGPGKEYLSRFPIPSYIIDANSKLVQNPGY